MAENPLDVKHPYMPPEGCYWAPGMEALREWDSWAEFFEEFAESDLDWNLVVRWDWEKPDPDDYDEADPMPDHDRLVVIIVGQRKGTLVTHWIAVDDADAPAVRAWLEPRWQRMVENWAPLSGGV